MKLHPVVRGGIFVGLLVVANLAFRDPLRELVGGNVLLVAIPVLLLGLGSLAFAFGPERWIEREAKRSKRAVLQPGVQRLSETSTRTQRVFYLVAGLLITGLGVAAILE